MATTPEEALLTPLPLFAGQQAVSVSMLRLDLLHGAASGNKWFKLAPNLEAAKAQSFGAVLTFGGAHSNHLAAAATACAAAGLRSTGVVRGWHGAAQETATLAQCRRLGMALHFTSREDYARKAEPEFLRALQAQFGPAFVIPEGGANEWGRQGAETIAALVPGETSHACVAVGTGTTFVGLRRGLPARVQLLGFPAMKGGDCLQPELAAFLPAAGAPHWQLQTGFSFGGFAKCPPALRSFMHSFRLQYGFPLDRVYTAKMMAGLEALIRQGAFPPGSRIVAVHTGGLQGNGEQDGRGAAD